jgi:hypothetical protein
MTNSPDHGCDEGPSTMSDSDDSEQFSRRAVLARAAAATAAAALAASDLPASAHSADPSSPEDMVAFLLLSATLTGVDPAKLAAQFKKGTSLSNSDPGSDPFDLKTDYFRWVNLKHPAPFERLLQIVKDNFNSASPTKAIIDGTNAREDTKYLARSIVLMWYLGSWYEPLDLKRAPTSDGPIPSEVISAKAYTQGWLWQIAAAHPMGYSNLQFGYWSRDPADPNEPKSPLDFKNALP